MFERIQLYIQTRPRRSLVIFLIFLTAVALLFKLLHYVNNGQVVVITNDENSSIELVRDGDTKIAAQSEGELHASVQPGKYIVTVSNRIFSSKRIVYSYARQTTTYNIKLSKPTDPDYVLPLGATNLTVGGSVMYYVNAGDHLLYRLDSSGVPRSVNSSVAFDSIKWRGVDYGVGLSDDNRLYSITNGSVSPIRLPFSGKPILDINPGGTLVVSDGKRIYEQVGGNFKKVFGPNGDIATVSLSESGRVFAVLSGGVVVIGVDGKVSAQRHGLSAYESVWSPDGERLAITGDEGAAIYTKRLGKVVDLPDGNVLGLTWLDNKTIVYASGNVLYSYSVDTSTSAQLSSVPIDSSITGVYAGSSSVVYLLSTKRNDPNEYGLWRVGASQQKTPAYNRTVGIFFPTSTPQCSFSYSNFLKPAVLITAWTNQDTCRDAAKEELKADRLPVSSFQIVFAPVAND